MEKLALLCPPHRPTVRLGKEVLLPRLALPLLGKTAVFPRLLPPPSPRPVLPRLALPLLGKTTVFPRLLPPPSPRSVLPKCYPSWGRQQSQATTSSPSQASALLPSSEGSRPPNPPWYPSRSS